MDASRQPILLLGHNRFHVRTQQKSVTHKMCVRTNDPHRLDAALDFRHRKGRMSAKPVTRRSG